MASAVEIANSALVTLGASTINSFEETSTEANIITVKWDIVRRSELRKHPWNFAIKRKELAQEVATISHRYDYKYTLPADLIRLLTVFVNADYKVEQRSILTNYDDCFIAYVFDNTNTEEWDPVFVELVVARLSLELAYTIPRAASMIDRMQARYDDVAQSARGIDATEDFADKMGFESELITARHSSVNTAGYF